MPTTKDFRTHGGAHNQTSIGEGTNISTGNTLIRLRDRLDVEKSSFLQGISGLQSQTPELRPTMNGILMDFACREHAGRSKYVQIKKLRKHRSDEET